MGDSGRGSLLSVDQLDGIGPQLAASLDALGYGTVEELSGLRPQQADGLADVVAGISRDGMRRAVAEARLHLVSEDSASIAALLLDAGITDLLRVMAVPTQTIVNLAGAGWGTERAALLQLDAARARLTFQILFRVIDVSGAPVADPRLEVADSGLADRRPVVVKYGDGQGWVLSPPLRRDRAHRVFVTASGQRRALIVRADHCPVQRRTLVLAQPPRRGPSAPDRTLVVGPATYLFDEVSLDAVQDGQVMRVGQAQAAEVPLRSVTRQFIPGGVITQVVVVSSADLPNGVGEGDYVVVDGGAVRAASDAERDHALRSRGGLLAERIRP